MLCKTSFSITLYKSFDDYNCNQSHYYYYYYYYCFKLAIISLLFLNVIDVFRTYPGGVKQCSITLSRFGSVGVGFVNCFVMTNT